MANTTYYVDTDIDDTDHTGLSWEDAFDHLSDVEALNLNLTTGATDGICTIWCKGATADVGAFEWQGWITSATQYVKITAEADQRAKASGWDAGIYRLAYGDGNSCFYVYDQYVWLDGLQFEITSNNDARSVVYYDGGNASNYFRMSNCRIRSAGSATYTEYGLRSADADAVMDVWNTIIENCGLAKAGSAAVWITGASAVVRLYNCTIQNSNIGMDVDAGTVTAANCAVFNNADDFSGTIDIDNCTSDDGDGTAAEAFTSEATDWNKVFTNYSTGDVTLKNYTSSPCCIGKALVDPGTLFSDDIAGTTRGVAWDIGAFEYVAASGSIVPLLMNHYRRLRV